MKKVLCYVAACVLCLTYIIILVFSLDTSNANVVYDLFYLKKELKYCPSMEEFLGYRENTLFEYTSAGNYLNQGRGWGSAESTATWTIGNSSKIYIYVDDPDAVYELQINTVKDMGYDNSLSVNGNEIGDLPHGETEHRIKIEKGLTEGLNVFEISTGEDVLPYSTLKPKSKDNRQLNMYVSSVILKKL